MRKTKIEVKQLAGLEMKDVGGTRGPGGRTEVPQRGPAADGPSGVTQQKQKKFVRYVRLLHTKASSL